MRPLVWFRADLRTEDNAALYHASRRADRGVVALFIVCPNQWKEHDWAEIKVDFMLRTLSLLEQHLEKLNIPLLIRETPMFDGCPEIIASVAKEHRCDALYYNREYEWNERQRDLAVTEAVEAQGMSVHACTDQVALAPGTVRTKEGGWYTVYSPFKRRWFELAQEEGGIRPLGSPKKQPAGIGIESDAIPDSAAHFRRAKKDARERWADLWPAGEVFARRSLGQFVARIIEEYKARRDFPAAPGTSKLSPHLAIGSISPRQCIAAAAEANSEKLRGGREGPGKWIEEIVWREFYKHLLIGYPRVSKHRAFQLDTEQLKWSDNDDHFEAWKDGRTGYPIVDAGMRQLNSTGWMHNRLRMITAMFLTKHLFIDWRKGERYFMQNLVDGDLASNNGGWQWSASTGTDAQPYFRVFNPTTQSERFDPDGGFIRAHVDELKHVQGKAIHEPSKAGLFDKGDYPEPIVEHKEARQHAIDTFRKLKKG